VAKTHHSAPPSCDISVTNSAPEHSLHSHQPPSASTVVRDILNFNDKNCTEYAGGAGAEGHKKGIAGAGGVVTVESAPGGSYSQRAASVKNGVGGGMECGRDKGEEESDGQNRWESGQLVPGAGWRRRRSQQIRDIQESLDAEWRLKERMEMSGGGGGERPRTDRGNVRGDGWEEEGQMLAEEMAGEGDGLPQQQKDRAKRSSSLLASIDVIAAGLEEAGLEDLSDIELARRIPPEIAMYEDLFKKILKSAEIIVQFGADAVPPADAIFQNKSIQAAQSRVDRYHLRHELAAHQLLAAAQAHRSKTLSKRRELAARRFYAREESLADINGQCVTGMASR
jgi:hypothetical protein